MNIILKFGTINSLSIVNLNIFNLALELKNGRKHISQQILSLQKLKNLFAKSSQTVNFENISLICDF